MLSCWNSIWTMTFGSRQERAYLSQSIPRENAPSDLHECRKQGFSKMALIRTPTSESTRLAQTPCSRKPIALRSPGLQSIQMQVLRDSISRAVFFSTSEAIRCFGVKSQWMTLDEWFAVGRIPACLVEKEIELMDGLLPWGKPYKLLESCFKDGGWPEITASSGRLACCQVVEAGERCQVMRVFPITSYSKT
jgi:hypothetical protein